MPDRRGWLEAFAGHRSFTIKSYPTLNHLFPAGEDKSTPAESQRPGHMPYFVLDDSANWIKKP
jgi:hypothetical protein